jgi:hypothetical protein
MILSQGRRSLNRRTITTVAKLGNQFPRSISSWSSSWSSSSSPFFNFDNNRQQSQCTKKSYLSTRYCSSTSDKKSEPKPKSTPPNDTAEAKNDESKDEGESLKDAVRRMQQEKGGSSSSDGNNFDDPRINDFVRQASDVWSNVTEEVGKTWGELLRSGERKDINKKIRHPEDTVDGEQEYSGPVAIMVIDESENLTAWERMQKRLTDAPLIQGKYNEYQYIFIQKGYTFYSIEFSLFNLYLYVCSFSLIFFF